MKQEELSQKYRVLIFKAGKAGRRFMYFAAKKNILDMHEEGVVEAMALKYYLENTKATVKEIKYNGGITLESFVRRHAGTNLHYLLDCHQDKVEAINEISKYVRDQRYIRICKEERIEVEKVEVKQKREGRFIGNSYKKGNVGSTLSASSSLNSRKAIGVCNSYFQPMQSWNLLTYWGM